MSPLAIFLVLGAAFAHATWNLLAKKARGGPAFAFLIAGITVLIYLPIVPAYCRWRHESVTGAVAGWIFVSGALKTAFVLLLHRSYRLGDFTLIYPLGRGTSPLFATLGAICLLHEHPSPLALSGSLLIVASIFHLAGGHRFLHAGAGHLRIALRYGAAVGLTVATFTVWDRAGMARLHYSPLLCDSGSASTTAVLLTPFILSRWTDVTDTWRRLRWSAAAIAALAALSYVLVLTAMLFTPVSYVASAREISIVIGAFFGSRLLGESDSRRRTWAACGITAGIAALALG